MFRVSLGGEVGMPKLSDPEARAGKLYSCLLLSSLLFTSPSLLAHGQTAVPEQAKTETLANFQPNSAKGDNYKVDVTSVIDVTSGGKTLHQISYTYSFLGIPSVYIKGIGTTTSTGSFSYMTAEPTLQFLDSPSGSLLAEVKLQETAVPMGSDSMELPDVPQANSSFRSSNWKPELTFPSAITAVIQKYFAAGYNTREVGNEHYYLTTFRTLRVSDPQLVSQIALIVSQPYDVTGRQISYRIQYVIRDRPRMSATFSTGSDTSAITQGAAMDFLNTFLSDVAGQGAHK
jgi:hypothetical protein